MTDQTDEAGDSREYRTGSNLPVRDRTAAGKSNTLKADSISDVTNRMPPRTLSPGN